MPGRKLLRDDRARVPFAMVAVLILMLSTYSMAYMGGIQRQEAGKALVGAEAARQRSILEMTEDRMALEGFYIASRSVAAATMFLCDQEALDACFQENYSAYLESAFPMFADPYEVDVRDFRACVFMEEMGLEDLVPSGRTVETNITVRDGTGAQANATVEALDTVTTEERNETTALARYVVAGSGNCTVRNTRTGSATEMPISFERGIDSPFPLMNSKAAALDCSAECNAMGLARSVRYILTTVAQFRVLEGCGSGLDGKPPTRDIITEKDVSLAVNLALVIETVRLFRDYDEAVVAELEGLGLGAAGSSLGSILATYLANGTLDPADIVALYMGVGDRDIPADIILAQAFSAIADQFILKYLDYFGIMDIANGVYKTGQELKQWVEGMGQELSEFISWDGGEGRAGHEQVAGWLASETGATAWPPAEVTAWGLDRGSDPAAPTDLAVLDVLQPIGQAFSYSGECCRLEAESSSPIYAADGRPVGETRYAMMSVRNISAATRTTAASQSPEGYLADFKPASMLRQAPELVSLWQLFYEEHYADGEDAVYATIRDAVKNVTAQLSGLILTFLGQGSVSLSAYASGTYAIDPTDRDSALEDMRAMLCNVMTDAGEYLLANPGAVGSLLSMLTDRQSQLTLRLVEFVSANYDELAGRNAQVAEAQRSLGLSALLNASWSWQEAGSRMEDYAVYNELGHSLGLVDEPMPYDCTGDPGTADYARALLGRCWAEISADMLPFAEAALSTLRDAESRFVRFGDPGNGLFVEALEDAASAKPDGVLARFVGSDPSSLICMARDMVIRVLDGMVWGGEVSDTQYAPELVFSEGGAAFDLHEGGRALGKDTGRVWSEKFEVTHLGGAIKAVPSGPGQGEITVRISEPAGVHLTDLTSFSETFREPLEHLGPRER
jgi:hypothetical protein